METYGDTQVTRHAGVPSWGQRGRNVFAFYLITLIITNFNPYTSPRLVSIRLVSAIFPFPHPATPILLPCLISHPPETNLVEED